MGAGKRCRTFPNVWGVWLETGSLLKSGIYKFLNGISLPENGRDNHPILNNINMLEWFINVARNDGIVR